MHAIAHSHHKQRSILAWLGFPGSEAMVRLLRKILPESASPSILRLLRNAVVADKRVPQLLASLRTINLAALELVTNQRLLDLVTPKLLREVSAQNCTPGSPVTGDLILGSLALLEEMSSRSRTRPFSSIRQVWRFQQETDAEYRAHLQRREEAIREAQRAAAEIRRLRPEERIWRAREIEWHAETARYPYPPPPVPGTSDIIPVTSAKQLWIEGAEQCNCVAFYVWRVLQGGMYIYRVVAPERATLAIVCDADGCWRRAEIRAKMNRVIRVSTVALVDAWLARYSVSV